MDCDVRSTQASHVSEVGTVAYQLSALTLFSKTCGKAVFSNLSHIALEAFLGQAKSNNAFTKGIRMIETPGAAAAHIQTRHRMNTDETLHRICTHVVDGLSLCTIPLGTVIDSASIVVGSMELCVALHFFPGSAATLVGKDFERLHTGKIGLQRTARGHRPSSLEFGGRDVTSRRCAARGAERDSNLSPPRCCALFGSGIFPSPRCSTSSLPRKPLAGGSLAFGWIGFAILPQPSLTSPPCAP